MTVVDIARLKSIVRQRGEAGRSVTAIAGRPGAGKSTLAEALAEALNAEEPGSAAVFPMDGYHYDARPEDEAIELLRKAEGMSTRKELLAGARKRREQAAKRQAKHSAAMMDLLANGSRVLEETRP